jgi:hypothetical protein
LQRRKIEKVEIVKIDTVEIVKQSEKIVVQKAKPIVKYLRDTIYKTRPFIAQLDTILKHDTIKAIYTFPEHLFDLKISSRADTFRIPQAIISTSRKEPNLFDRIIHFVAGATFGYALSRIK